LFGVKRSRQAIWQWVRQISDSVSDPPEAKPKPVAVGETAVKINGNLYWLYAAIDLESELILDAELLGRHGTDPAATFLHALTRNTISLTPRFLSTALAIRLSLLD